MPRTMAGGYCTRELEQVASQLLPPEIIAEIGIVDDTVKNSAATACRSHAVIEGLAAHLASILSLAGKRTQHRPRPAIAAPHNQHVSRVLKTNGGGSMGHVAPGSGKNDDTVLCPGTVKIFATPVPALPAGANLLPERRQNGRSGTGVFLPARRHNGSGGTGVFMPLAGAYRTRPFKSPSSKGPKPPRLMRKEAPMPMSRQDARQPCFKPFLP
ncbi:hypothetical protein SETIT_3G074600v2 [Setaria italica]|uniref:Uncharacterized protein n=1 Tax=Setaria italica TaxID=4555 RepID=A0A368QCE4_SETIT|nr:uncharacterized protein LOC111256617 [Setaria italica]RCV15655.1 hypothetical protein SETIT_3G074600v2 [Setaria italica]